MPSDEDQVPTPEEAARLMVAPDPTYAHFTLLELREMLDGLGVDEGWRARRIRDAIDRMERIRAAQAKHGYRAVADATLRLQLETGRQTARRRPR